MRWLQVELTLKGELAEPVAEVLARYASGGVAITAADPAGGSAMGQSPVTVRAFLPEDDRLPVQRGQIEEGLWHLSQIQPLPAPNYEFVDEVDWAEAWKSYYRPIPIGENLLVQPAWFEDSTTGRTVIQIDPGMAFGTGTHPSTRHCLELLEQHLQPGDTVVDLGSGSGILSIAAIKLGARRVVAYDIERTALEAGRGNAAINGVRDQIEFRQGSLEDLLGAVDEGLPVDVIVVNILASVIEGMLEAGLADALPPDSLLILAGILEDQLVSVQRAATDRGLRPVSELRDDDWRTLLLMKNPSLEEGREEFA